MLPVVTGEYGIVGEPEIRFSSEGKSWAKLRGKAADRVRDSNGAWKDGDALFIDIVVLQGAENVVESVSKGDAVVVTGRLRMREWDKDGVKQTTYQIVADSVGVSTRWKPVGKGNAKPKQEEEAPF